VKPALVAGALWAGGTPCWRQTQEFTCLGGQAAANDQVDAAAGAHFVKQHVALELELAATLPSFSILPS
jgi:hypothetical protein